MKKSITKKNIFDRLFKIKGFSELNKKDREFVVNSFLRGCFELERKIIIRCKSDYIDLSKPDEYFCFWICRMLQKPLFTINVSNFEEANL